MPVRFSEAQVRIQTQANIQPVCDIVVHGPPGTGKTQLFLNPAGASHPRGSVTATSHKAIENRDDAHTLWSLFGINPSIALHALYDPWYMFNIIRAKQKDPKLFQVLSLNPVLYIDEAYTVPSWQMTLLLMLVRLWERMNKRIVRLILTGDPRQCAPIGRDDGGEHDCFAYWFEDKYILAHFRHLRVFTLHESHRHIDAQTQELVRAFRMCEFQDCHIAWLRQRMWTDPIPMDSGITQLVSTRREVESITSTIMAQFANNVRIRIVAEHRNRPPGNNDEHLLDLAIGCKIVLSTTVGEHTAGAAGTIVAFGDYDGDEGTQAYLFGNGANRCSVKAMPTITVRMTDGQTVVFEALLRKADIDAENRHTIRQFPFITGYALTIHKSQGMTLQRVAVDLSQVFAPGMALTAVSRIRTIGPIPPPGQLCTGLIITGLNLDKLRDRALNIDPAVERYLRNPECQHADPHTIAVQNCAICKSLT